AHKNISSKYKVSKYGVCVENLEKDAVPSIEPDSESIIILDEIGKMECFSAVFKETVLKALDSENIVLGTISVAEEKFTKEIKERDDVEIIEINSKNRDELPEQIIEKIMKLKS
ncbi:nucleoside-triphosphatase, partial [Bdellovibrionota bacterium]